MTTAQVGVPLAERMRPQDFSEFVGQQHLLSSDKPLRQMVQHGQCHSMIFWGVPGSGKTTLARMFARVFSVQWLSLSAVLAGVKEIRSAIEQAKMYGQNGQKTIVFVDEVHRFNKSQQDAFLPHIEDGTIIFIGATTENPSFALNNALLSRARVYVLKPLKTDDLVQILTRALTIDEQMAGFHLFKDQIEQIANSADGDARRALNFLEIANDLAIEEAGQKQITNSALALILSGSTRRFDHKGEYFYNQISALHKSVRGSNPDASLYWLVRMLEAGAEPLYLARRLIRIASEDIGNADPRALSIANDAAETYERLGSPEGELALAQCVIYLAVAAKSNAVYKAYKKVRTQVSETGTLSVPVHLCNAPTKLMKELDYGKAYRYAHDEPYAYAANEQYLPDEMVESEFYSPTDRGLERKIKQRLDFFRSLDESWKSNK